MPEYQGRVKLRIRPFPLEVARHLAAPRDILEQEWWLAALQEPGATFAPYRGDDWPETTLPAFEAAWGAAQEGDDAFYDYDLRLRRAFFAESRNIGRREVLLDIAKEAGLNVTGFARRLGSAEARTAVLQETQMGRDRYNVRGTPTVMLADGTCFQLPIAFPVMRDRRVVGVGKLPCCGDGCLEATRNLFEQAVKHQQK